MLSLAFIKNQNVLYIIQSVLTIFLGGLIYIIYRSESLLMFKWFSLLGIEIAIDYLRTLNFALPDWVIFSLPDALWVYSLALIMIYIWDGELNINSVPWILLAPIIGIFGEVAQLFGLIGTFDLVDLGLCFLVSVIVILQVKYFNINTGIKVKNVT